MSVARWTCGVLVLLVAADGVAVAQGVKKGRQNPAQLRENAKEEAVDRLAEQVFNEADGNHNHVLSRSESATADELLQNGIMSLVEQGVLGMPLQQGKGKGKNGKKQVQVQAPNGAAVFGPPPSTETKKGKSISLNEFKAYAHTMAQQADAQWAETRPPRHSRGARAPAGDAEHAAAARPVNRGPLIRRRILPCRASAMNVTSRPLCSSARANWSWPAFRCAAISTCRGSSAWQVARASTA